MKKLGIIVLLVLLVTISARSEENTIHKNQIGYSFGLSYPNNVLSYPIFIGLKHTVFFDTRLGKYSLLYSNINYSSYEPDETALNSNFQPGTNYVYNSKDSKPYKLYSLIAGWGLTSSSTGRVPAIRVGVGLFLDYSREDEINVTYLNVSNEVVKKNINAKNKFSAGINFRVGLDVPLFRDIIGFSIDFDLNPKIIGPDSPSTTQHPAGASLMGGLFVRF